MEGGREERVGWIGKERGRNREGGRESGMDKEGGMEKDNKPLSYTNVIKIRF